MKTEEESLAANGSSEISDLENKIIRQVEYYFGDYNLCRDKFLKIQLKENDGWIPLETMVKFNRLKQISEDCKVIASALKKSPNEILEVNEDETQIRRNPLKPLPLDSEERKEEVLSRSVYVKGFKVDTSLDELLEFFKQFGNAENILMRKTKVGKRKFKGSVFVTFKTVEEAKKFLQEKLVSYKGTSLIREAKKDYLARKEVEYLERKKLVEQKHAQKALEKEKMDEMEEKESNIKKEPNDAALNFTKGCLLKLSGFKEGTMREDIKPIFEPHGTISFIDFYRDDPEGVLRFESPIAAEVLQKVSKEVDGARRVEIKGTDILATVIEGDDEEEYYKNVKRKIKEMKNRNKSAKQNRGGGRGKGRGFRKGRGNKRRFDNDGDDAEGSPKKIKEEIEIKNIKMEDKSVSED